MAAGVPVMDPCHRGAPSPLKGGFRWQLLGKGGLEPPTLRLSGVYSCQLSYLPAGCLRPQLNPLAGETAAAGWHPFAGGGGVRQLEGKGQGALVSGQVKRSGVDKKGNHKEKGDCQGQ